MNFSDPLGLCPPIKDCYLHPLKETENVGVLERGQHGGVRGWRFVGTSRSSAVLGINELGHPTLFVQGAIEITNGKEKGLPVNKVTVNAVAADLESGQYDVMAEKFLIPISAAGNFKTGMRSVCVLAVCQTKEPPNKHTVEELEKEANPGSGG